jgi:hypothetical protein
VTYFFIQPLGHLTPSKTRTSAPFLQVVFFGATFLAGAFGDALGVGFFASAAR